MKRMFVSLVAAIIMSSVTVAMAAPAPKATGGVTFDLASGGTPQSLSFNAHDVGASALDKGEATYTNFDAGITYTAEVLCANVDVAAHTAYFAYEIPAGTDGLGGIGIVFRVVDGGTPGTNGDQISFGVFANGAAAVTACENSTLGAVVLNNTITGGNLIVHKK